MYLFFDVCSRDEDEVQKIYEAELSFLESCLKVNPKSYGSWHHRGWVSVRLPRPDWARELSLCDRCLSLDDRNCKYTEIWTILNFVVIISHSMSPHYFYPCLPPHSPI